ncbi:hypothetical protein ACFQU2_39825 [Siccirubricoccus deserti]
MDARDRLRTLLARIDYQITGDSGGGLLLTIGGSTVDISPEGREEEWERDDAQAERMAAE